MAAFTLVSISACGTANAAPAPAATSTAVGAGWTEPARYAFTLTTGCTRGFFEARYRITVRDGRVVTTDPLNEQATTHADFAAPTLGDIDTWITTTDLGNPGIRRERDPADGHPTAYGFDPDAMAYDGGSCYAVSEYAG